VKYGEVLMERSISRFETAIPSAVACWLRIAPSIRGWVVGWATGSLLGRALA